MFFGEYEHSIDDKSRLTLPAKFRDAFADGVVLTRGLDTCLVVFARAEWKKLADERLAPLDPFAPETRKLMRFFFGAATDADLDKQGRVLVPSALVAYAGLGREVVIAGVRDHLEIWDRTSWAAQVTTVEGSADDVAERLADRRS